ncbi:MAG TPA: ABC transporter, partial [Pseudorhodoferax sp.]|nr:ABC transporter [Pseudorhodoferax sp.]
MKLIRTLIATAALGLGFCAAAQAQTPGPVKVGVIFPLSGGAGPQGQHVT